MILPLGTLYGFRATGANGDRGRDRRYAGAQEPPSDAHADCAAAALE